MVHMNRWHYITLVALLLCAVNCSANAVKHVTIHLKFDKTHKHATGMAKVQPHPGGEVKVTIVAPSGGWKIHDCKLSPTTGVSKSYGPLQDSSQKPKSSVTLTVTVAQAARYAPIAVATEGHLVHPGGHGGGKLPDFNAPVVHPVYVTVSQVNIAPAHVVGVNSEFTVDINAKANNLQKDTVVTWTDFSAIIKYSQQQPEDVGDPGSYKDTPSYEWVNELALQDENDQHSTTAIGEGTLKFKKAGYYMIIGNATCTFTKPDGSDSSSSDHNPDDDIADNDNVTVVAITATATLEKNQAISAQSSCEITSSEYSAQINVSSIPKGYEDNVELKIVDRSSELQNPSLKGNCSGSGKIRTYHSYLEPIAAIHPKTRVVTIGLFISGVDTGNTCTATVWSVYKYLTSPLVITKTGQSGEGTQYMRAYNFIRCKYFECLESTNGNFKNVIISDNYSVQCSAGNSFGCTTFAHKVTFGLGAFDKGENYAATTIGHELKHTDRIVGTTTECVAYTWELEHFNCTGLHKKTRKNDVESRKQDACNNNY